MKKPTEIVKQWDKSQKHEEWFYYEIPNGLNNSLYRMDAQKCVFAYYIRDGHLTLGIKTASSGYKEYMLCKEFRQAKVIDITEFIKGFPNRTGYDYKDTHEFEIAKTKVFVKMMCG